MYFLLSLTVPISLLLIIIISLCPSVSLRYKRFQRMIAFCTDGMFHFTGI